MNGYTYKEKASQIEYNPILHFINNLSGLELGLMTVITLCLLYIVFLRR